MTFSVGDVQFDAHRVVLAASTGFLGALVRTEMQERDRKVIDINEDPSLFKQCLDFLYGLPIRIHSSQACCYYIHYSIILIVNVPLKDSSSTWIGKQLQHA